SSEMAFRIAASQAYQDAAARAGPIILEPIMQVEVVVPEEYLGDVIGDINSKRGHIEGMESRLAGQQIVRANIPLASMFGYATDLRSRTQGRATFTMETSHYAQVPNNFAQEIIARFRGVSM
ncbi:MAG: elongation factor G, partial [Symbiobacteriaceae bacterium]|nr:elongation factor G [Symbiobacteriaceae bacterium]